MAITYEPIATETLGGAAASVTFSSISGAYTDLVLVSDWTVSAQNNLLMTFNSDTGSNYSETVLLGDGSSASSSRQTSATSIRVGFAGNVSSKVINIVNIQNYSNTTTYKTTVYRWNSEEYVSARVGLWRDTSAITSLVLTASAGNIASGSTFTLYGIASA